MDTLKNHDVNLLPSGNCPDLPLFLSKKNTAKSHKLSIAGIGFIEGFEVKFMATVKITKERPGVCTLPPS